MSRCALQNVGRRRYPHFWFSGVRTFVHPQKEKLDIEQPTSGAGASEKQQRPPHQQLFSTELEAEEAALEGRAAYVPVGRENAIGDGRESASGFAPARDAVETAVKPR